MWGTSLLSLRLDFLICEMGIMMIMGQDNEIMQVRGFPLACQVNTNISKYSLINIAVIVICYADHTLDRVASNSLFSKASTIDPGIPQTRKHCKDIFPPIPAAGGGE